MSPVEWTRFSHLNPIFAFSHITETHEHIGMTYRARPKNGELTLSGGEHHDIRWCSADDLDRIQPSMSNAVKWYCRKAIEEIGRPN